MDVRIVLPHLRCHLFPREASNDIPLRSTLHAIWSDTGTAFVGQLLQCYRRLQFADAEGHRKVELCYRCERRRRVDKPSGEHSYDQALWCDRRRDRLSRDTDWI